MVHFFAEWASECQPMNEVLEALSKEEDLKVFIVILIHDLKMINFNCFPSLN